MPRTYIKILIHCVFSTKHRRSTIREPERVWRIIREIARNLKVDIPAIGGTSNHVHILVALPSNRSLADIMRDVKANSSLILREENRSFRWQDGYSAVSLGPSATAAVIRYIENQEQHHKTSDFDREYISMLERAGIAYAPEYVLD
jgi:REP element-mobilizing transposase RayT